MKFAKEYYGSD